jgi:hypothetical protein
VASELAPVLVGVRPTTEIVAVVERRDRTLERQDLEARDAAARGRGDLGRSRLTTYENTENLKPGTPAR